MAIYGVPVLAGAVTAAVLLGPGRARPVDGVQIWALVAEGARRVNLDVSTVRHEAGLMRSAPHDGLAIELTRGERVLGSFHGSTAPDGHLDANLELAEPARERLGLRLRAGGRRVTETELAVRAPLSVEPRRPVEVAGTPRLLVSLPRGFAVPEMPEQLEVRVLTEAGSEPPTLEVTADGARVEPPEARGQSCDGACETRFTVTFVANATSTTLSVTARHEGSATRWHGAIPLAPGRIWLHPDARPLRLRAPYPVAVAHVTLLSRHGQIWGREVAMTTDAHGFSSGEVAAPAWLDQTSPLALLAASEPHDTAGAHWPLTPGDRLVPARPQLVLDTLPAAIAAEEARWRAARRPAYGLVLAAGLFELLFLAHRTRRSSRSFQRHLEGSEIAPETARALESRTPLWWLSVLTLGLVLAFVVLAGLAAFAQR